MISISSCWAFRKMYEQFEARSAQSSRHEVLALFPELSAAESVLAKVDEVARALNALILEGFSFADEDPFKAFRSGDYEFKIANYPLEGVVPLVVLFAVNGWCVLVWRYPDGRAIFVVSPRDQEGIFPLEVWQHKYPEDKDTCFQIEEPRNCEGADVLKLYPR